MKILFKNTIDHVQPIFAFEYEPFSNCDVHTSGKSTQKEVEILSVLEELCDQLRGWFPTKKTMSYRTFRRILDVMILEIIHSNG